MNNSQKIAELIETLAKEKGVSVSTMLSELGMNKNALFTMKNSGYLPRLENLAKFADYFNVTLDFFLGRAENPVIGGNVVGPNTTESGNIIAGDATINQSSPTAGSSSTDETTAGFMEVFQKLNFEKKLAVMNFTMELLKRGTE